MSFLAPLFLLGGAAIALPIVFHLIRRTSRERIPFSSLMFLAPSPPRLTRRSRLENILLLLLRCAVLILLAAAFARPFLRQPLQAGGTTMKRVVLLIDTSASMRREQLFSAARAKAAEVSRKAGRSDELAVLLFDRVTRTLLSFEEWNNAAPAERAKLVQQRLDSIQPGWAATHLGHALIAACELAGDSAGSRPTEIAVISDFEEGAHLDGLQGFQWPKNVSVVPVSVKTRRTANAGPQFLAASATSPTDHIKVRVSNSSDSRVEQFQLRWSQEPSNMWSIYVAPGQSRVLELSRPAKADRLILAGDDFDFDNDAWFAAPRASQVDVLFAGANAPADPRQPMFYVRRALSSTANETVRLNILTNADPAACSNASLIVVAGSLPDAQAALITDRVNAGATALWVIGNDADGAALGKAAQMKINAPEAVLGNKYAMLGEIDFSHPLFSPFAEPRFSDFTKIHFWKHRKLSFAPASAARVAARFDDGDPAVAQLAVGKGTVFALASGWSPAESQFALSSKFVPFLYALLEFSGAIKAQARSYHVGDSVDLAPFAGGGKISVRKPNGGIVEMAAGQNAFTDTEQPGIYTVASAQPPLDFAVNIPPEESRTAAMAIEDIQKLGVPLNASLAASSERGARKAAQLQATEIESRQRAWRWLIAATLMVLMVETWIAARLTRRAVVAVGT